MLQSFNAMSQRNGRPYHHLTAMYFGKAWSQTGYRLCSLYDELRRTRIEFHQFIIDGASNYFNTFWEVAARKDLLSGAEKRSPSAQQGSGKRTLKPWFPF